ncbi:MAG: hypothetical protein HY238_12290 [Acidobacteria bacterium]|nr:hypothetical protein [Acidobacteriota bacterium]
MIDVTQRKLREAEFFLWHLVDDGQKAVRNEPEAFGFYLSAFLSAGRSVTFALQYEEKAKYDKWFPHWFGNLSAEDQNLLKFSKDQRNSEQKRGGADVTVIWEYVPVTQVRTERATHPAYGFHWFGPPGTPPPRVGIPVHLFESSRGDQQVTLACQRYVGLLARLVEDFVQAHS